MALPKDQACDAVLGLDTWKPWRPGEAASRLAGVETPWCVAGGFALDLWRGGAATHLGISVAGFPNAFLVVGPNTGLGHNSLVFMIESQVDYIVAALRRLRESGRRTLEVRAEVQARSYADVQRRLKGTVWASGCRSWYLSADGRNDSLWPGSTLDYWRRTLRFDAENYS